MAATSSSQRGFIKKVAFAGIAATGISNVEFLAATNFSTAIKESQLIFLF